jgi:hypothetical protein
MSAVCRCGATTSLGKVPRGWCVGIDGTTGVCAACQMRRPPAELHQIARDALRAVGIDVPDDITPEQILILTDDLLEGA